MGFFSKRHFLLTICTLQLFTTVERQVFDFLGFMWGPILVNFFNIIFVILGFFGAFQYQIKYLITYCLWDLLWLGWNIFCICFYLEIAGLDKMSEILNFGTGSLSWWQANGPGCKPIYDVTQPEFYPPTNVTDCLLNYKVVEVIHASTQCILAFLAIIGGICLSKTFIMEEDDSSQINKKKKQQRPLYSIEYSIRPSEPPEPQDDNNVSPKPMTPRRVKRRSVISRDHGTRRSNRRSSVRQSRRKNPVNRIMEQQESLYANTIPSSTLTNHNVNSLSQGILNYDRIAITTATWDRERNTNAWQPPSHPLAPPPPPPSSEAINLALSTPTIWTPDPGYSNVPNIQQQQHNINNNNNNNNHHHHYQHNQQQEQIPTWESNSSMRNLTDNNNWQNNPMQWQGQTNPTFQQTSTQSLNDEDMDDVYGNRPASARSSYSNYHGVRATPQVPSRTDIVRQSQRQFVLSGGPPAYQDTVI